MNARRIVSILTVVAGTCLLGASLAWAATKVRAVKVSPIAVDGRIDDWKDVGVQYFDQGPRVTAIAHDGRFLYVHFRFSDLSLARRVLRSGAIVWVNGDGDHEASFGLRYRGSQELEAALRELDGPRDEAPGGPPGGDSRGGGRPGQRPPLERPPLGALEILHLGVVDEVITAAKPDGVAAASAMADGAFAYELRVPLSEVAPATQLGGAGLPTRIAIGFQMGGMTPAELKARREHMRSGGGPPEGGPGGGHGGGASGRTGGGLAGLGGGPRGGGPPGGDRSSGPEGRARDSEVVWVDVELLDLKVALDASR